MWTILQAGSVVDCSVTRFATRVGGTHVIRSAEWIVLGFGQDYFRILEWYCGKRVLQLLCR
jgi:hypothetical protein